MAQSLRALRGKIKFENKVLDDFVLLKSDGYPTYQLANVVDDHLMGITHVIRRRMDQQHAQARAAYVWLTPPVMAHLPVVLSVRRQAEQTAWRLNSESSRRVLSEAW